MYRQDAQIFDPFKGSYGAERSAAFPAAAGHFPAQAEMDWGTAEHPEEVEYPAAAEYPAEAELTSEESLDWEQPACERIGLGEVLHLFAEASEQPFVWWAEEAGAGRRAGPVSGLASADSIAGFAAALGADEPKSLGYVPACLEQADRLSRPDVEGLVRAHLEGGAVAYVYPTVFVLELFGIEPAD